jgi:hypothetical protein
VLKRDSSAGEKTEGRDDDGDQETLRMQSTAIRVSLTKLDQVPHQRDAANCTKSLFWLKTKPRRCDRRTYQGEFAAAHPAEQPRILSPVRPLFLTASAEPGYVAALE